MDISDNGNFWKKYQRNGLVVVDSINGLYRIIIERGSYILGIRGTKTWYDFQEIENGGDPTSTLILRLSRESLGARQLGGLKHILSGEQQ